MSVKEKVKEQVKAGIVFFLFLVAMAVFLYFFEQKPLTHYSAEEYETIYGER